MLNRAKLMIINKLQAKNWKYYNSNIYFIQIEQHHMSFIEVEPPQLSLFFAVKQQKKQTNIDYCPHLISLCPSPSNQDISYAIFTAKQGYLTVITLQEGCVLAKSNIEVIYGYTNKITMIKAEVYHSMHEGAKQEKIAEGVKQEKNRNRIFLFVFLGFQDGTVAMYGLAENGVRPLIPILKHRPKLGKKQSIINVSIIKNDLLIVSSYSIFLVKKIFEKEFDSTYFNNSKNKSQTFIEKQINIDINSNKLDIDFDLNLNNLYVFNQYDGAVCLDLQTMQQHKRVQDCIKSLKVCQKIMPKQAMIVATGGTDNAIKFIDYKSNLVSKFVGLKNYPTCLFEDECNKMLWVGDLHGTIACFSYCNTKQRRKESFVMQQIGLKYQQKICQTGIKKILVHKNLFIVFDCNHDIFFFDIIRPSPTTERETSSMEDEQT